jgi:hypothetical protein
MDMLRAFVGAHVSNPSMESFPMMNVSKIAAASVLASLFFACGGATTQDTSTADVTGASSPTVMRGELDKGQLMPVMIVEKQGPEDSERVDVDMSKTKLAGAEPQLLVVFPHKEFWIRGSLTKKEVASAGSTTISREILVADTVATAQDGVLKKTGGTYIVEVKTGTGKNSDDAGSVRVDVTGLKTDVASLVGKTVHAEGLLVREITGVFGGKTFISNELLIASSLK